MPNSPTPPISSPLRILVLSPSSTPIPLLIKDPTLSLSTPYYSATVPVWHDILPLSTSELRQWSEEWRSEEAGEVVRAVGAWVVIFRKVVPDERNGEGKGEVTLPKLRTLLTTVSTFLTHHASAAASSYAFASEPLLLAVGVHQPLNPCLELSTEEWEDLCRECGGWEWIDGEVGSEMGKGKGDRDEFGEKFGLPRLLEALEANDWSADLNSDPKNDDVETDSDFDSILGTIEISEAGLGRPKSRATQLRELDLQASLLEVQQTFQTEENGQGEGEREGADSQVQELEAMMLKMQAVK
ncbi:hypothetical protein MMC29_006798, partial [Sticta canariensis]|nr:hypothetical protein [Sticta canariensis]